MWQYPKDFDLFDQIGKYAKTAGIVFMILGLIGAIYPIYASFATVVFVAWLMLIAGMFAAYFTYVTDRTDWAGWLKSVILIGVALYMLFSPLGGVATLGLLFSIYFFMDAFTGFGLAFSAEGQKHKWIWFFNAAISLVLAIIFIIGWPFTSLWLVGFFVGVSLFFDGIALLVGGSALNALDEKEEK